MQRLGLSLLAVLMLSACTSTGGISDRYAFWRDNGPKADNSVKPNLADVPVPPNTQDAQAEMDTMRQRLETDRNNAYAAAEGLPVSDIQPISDEAAAPYSASVATQEMAPVTSMPTAPYYAAPVAAYPAQPQTNGTVQYNYAPTEENYVYGNSNLQYARAQQYAGQAPGAGSGFFRQEADQLMAANSNVSINLDALDDGAASNGLSPVGLTGLPIVYFKHGSSRLGSIDRAKIKELAERLKAASQSVVVIGHASQRTGIKNPVTSKSANLTMSAKRATAVMNELARHGVKARQLNVSAEGDTKSGGKETEAQDRRVDILFD